MRIAVLIPSRNRPLNLMETILRMDRRTSGEHEVHYVIGCDLDDGDTIAMALSLVKAGLPVIPKIGPRQSSLGNLVNLLAEKCPADVYCSLADDVEVETDGWDRVIAETWTAEPDGVWWWCSQNGATFAIVSEKWRAASGRIFTDYFPFWYDDMWLIELQRYVLGRRGDRINVWLRDNAPATHRMRDLAEWDAFFWSRRDERKEEARRIAERLGRPVPDLSLDLGKNPAFDAAAMAKVEARQGEKAAPTPEYLAAYKRMKILLNQHKEAA